MARPQPIRTAARAIIIQDAKLLAIQMRDWRGIYYILPGGGQLPGETLEQAVRRECLEEAGVSVRVRELLYVREYIGRNHDFSKNHNGFHQLEHVFRCDIVEPARVRIGHECDHHQVGVAWLDLATIREQMLFPAIIKPFFTDNDIQVPSMYLGDCN